MVGVTFELGNVKMGLNSGKWRYLNERFVKRYVLRFGPFFFVRDRLPFCRDAAGREFDRMNAPGRGTRNLADAYRRRG